MEEYDGNARTKKATGSAPNGIKWNWRMYLGVEWLNEEIKILVQSFIRVFVRRGIIRTVNVKVRSVASAEIGDN